MRLINADEIQYTKDWVVTDKIPKVGGYNAKAIYRVTKEEIDAMPTVDAVPARHGQWKRHYCEDDGLPDGWQCTACGEWYYFGENKPNYCPNCGARMDGKDGDHAQDKKS